jgi:hypothetical protein
MFTMFMAFTQDVFLGFFYSIAFISGRCAATLQKPLAVPLSIANFVPVSKDNATKFSQK